MEVVYSLYAEDKFIHKLFENLKGGGGEHVRDPGVDGRIILKWTLEK
jgi:hypothetical protein